MLLIGPDRIGIYEETEPIGDNEPVIPGWSVDQSQCERETVGVV